MEKTILVVDNTHGLSALIASLLSSQGYPSDSAVDGLDAKQKLKENIGQYALVATDIEMPNINGLKLTRYIRENYNSIIIIMMSSNPKYKEQAMKAGADDFVVKDANDIFKIISTVKKYMPEKI